MIHKMLIPHSIMDFPKFIILVFLLRSLSEVTEPEIRWDGEFNKKYKINHIKNTKIQELLSMNCSINSAGINSIKCFLKLETNIMRHF